MKIQFTIDNKQQGKPFPHYWELCVGSCHAYTALREDYRKQLKRAHDELGFRYIRFHGIFDDDMCVCVEKKDRLSKTSEIVYNFVNIDNIFDFLLQIGMKPFVELGFMPACLASGDLTCFHYKANITPPRDYALWEDFIYEFTKHCVERYGLEEVKSWFFEVWNEPNLQYFWSGTQEEYFRLYESTARIIKQVNPSLKVGGPSTSTNAWVPETIHYCTNNNVPLDFISTHHYPTGDLLWKNRDMSLEEFFRIMGDKFGKYERGILKIMAEHTRKEAGSLPLYYTEWNTSAMTNDNYHDECFASAMISKILADNDGLVDGYSFWTFTDIFEESSQLKGVFHGGFGLMTYAGIAKPAYRTFQLYHALGTERLTVEHDWSEGETAEIIATRTKNRGIRAILYNHQIPEEEIKEEECVVIIRNVSEDMEITCYPINEDSANPKGEWIRMGSPEYLKSEELQKLHNASKIQTYTPESERHGNDLIIKVKLPVYGVCGIDIAMK